jgi:aldehyde dehydrogenase (NAD+)
MADLAFTPTTKMLVDGELIDADDSSTFDNVNPATEEVLGQVPDASTAEMQRAIAAWPVQA